MAEKNIHDPANFGKDPGNKNQHKKEGQIDVESDNRPYNEDETINEDMKANNPTGVGENEEAHWTEGSDDDKDEKPQIP